MKKKRTAVKRKTFKKKSPKYPNSFFLHGPSGLTPLAVEKKLNDIALIVNIYARYFDGVADPKNFASKLSALGRTNEEIEMVCQNLHPLSPQTIARILKDVEGSISSANRGLWEWRLCRKMARQKTAKKQHI